MSQRLHLAGQSSAVALAKLYLLNKGLSKVTDLSNHQIETLRTSLVKNIDSLADFTAEVEASRIDLPKFRLEVIFKTETHQANEFGKLEYEMAMKQKKFKVWVT